MEGKEKLEDNITIDLDNRCPDFDEDCKDVKDHLQCFLGCWKSCCNGKPVDIGTAQGYCPFIHQSN